jgi:hypothetical protein
VWWGALGTSDLTLRLFGGPVPGRRGRVEEVHVPTFVPDKRYLVFLSNRDWRLSPVTARQSYAIERVHGKEILVSGDGHALAGIDDAEGPRRLFSVYTIPDEVEDGFIPGVDPRVTPAMVARAYSVPELMAALRAWSAQQDVFVHGRFNERPFTTGVWRILRATPDASTGAAVAAPELAPRGDRPAVASREPNACGEHPVPTDSEPGGDSSRCLKGGVQ